MVEIVNAPASPPPARQQSGQTGGAVNASPPAAQPTPAPTTGQQGSQPGGVVSYVGQQLGVPTSLQGILNTMPAITIAGNSLKFQFDSENWTAMLNGENFSKGTIEVENINDGSILTLKQTHIWPAAAVKTAGNLAGKLGGSKLGGAANAAGNVAGKAGPVETSGSAIVLEYKAGPPAKLSYLRSTTASAQATPTAASSAQPATTTSVAATPTALPSASAPVASPDSKYIVLADAQWIEWVGTENTATKKDTTVQFSIANEEIGGQVREVLTLVTNLAKGSGWRISQIELTNETIVQTLQKGSGVRFKVLGDGKKWKLIIGTNEANKDGCFYEIPIATKEGKVVEVDVPYSKLKQPPWGKKVRFVKNSIMCLTLQRHTDIGGTGPSTIKIFDFEIY